MSLKIKTSFASSSWYGWLICGLAAAFYCYEYLLRISPSAMVPELMSTFGQSAAAIGLLFIATHYITGILLIMFFMALIPSNIYAAQNHINLEKADFSGKGLSYLWFRIPLQLFFIGWIWYFAVLN